MRSSRPYMIRAMHEWIVDSNLTPYALVDATHANVVIPQEYVEDGKILLNVSPNATQNLNLGNEFVLFHARFNGISMEVSFPIDSVIAIYAKENGRGMMFKDDDQVSEEDISGSSEKKSQSSYPTPVAVQTTSTEENQAEIKNSASDKTNSKSSDNNDPDDKGPNDSGPSGSPSTKKPSLKIVK